MQFDVVANNLPAIHVSRIDGFSYVDTVDLGYGEFGLDWFRLYEKLL